MQSHFVDIMRTLSSNLIKVLAHEFLNRELFHPFLTKIDGNFPKVLSGAMAS